MAWRKTAESGHGVEPDGARLARRTTASLAGLLAERGMTRKDLADRMGVSPGRVSQILSGDENLTLRSLAAVAESLDARVEITFHDSLAPHEARADATPSEKPRTSLAASAARAHHR